MHRNITSWPCSALVCCAEASFCACSCALLRTFVHTPRPDAWAASSAFFRVSMYGLCCWPVRTCAAQGTGPYELVKPSVCVLSVCYPSSAMWPHGWCCSLHRLTKCTHLGHASSEDCLSDVLGWLGPVQEDGAKLTVADALYHVVHLEHHCLQQHRQQGRGTMGMGATQSGEVAWGLGGWACTDARLLRRSSRLNAAGMPARPEPMCTQTTSCVVRHGPGVLLDVSFRVPADLTCA